MITRMVARMALVKALTHKVGENYPTIAGERVFDSRLVPVQLAADGDKIELPIACVYSTDFRMSKDQKKERSPSFTGVSYRQDFVIEIRVATYEAITIDGKLTTRETIAENDAELMAVLDMFEAQVWRVLHDAINPWTVLWGKLNRNALDYDSELDADGEKNNKYARRQITLGVDLCPDPRPQYAVTDEQTIIRPDSCVPAGLFGLSETYLTDVVRELVGQSDTATIVHALQSTLGGGSSTLLPRLRSMGVVLRGDPIEQEPKGMVLAKQEITLGE